MAVDYGPRRGLIELRATEMPEPKRPKSQSFKRGDLVEWNSEAGRVRGVIIKKVTADLRWRGYVHHASRADPQYLIKSVKTDHVAIHNGQALRRVHRKGK